MNVHSSFWRSLEFPGLTWFCSMPPHTRCQPPAVPRRCPLSSAHVLVQLLSLWMNESHGQAHTYAQTYTETNTHVHDDHWTQRHTYIQNTQPLHQPLNHVKTNSLSLKHCITSVYISCYSCKRPYLSLLNRFI